METLRDIELLGAADALDDGVDDLKKLGDQSRELAKLKALEGWAMLEELVKERGHRLTALFTQTVVNAGQEINQREVDKLRGVLEGMRFVLSLPDSTRRKHERKSQNVERRTRQ